MAGQHLRCPSCSMGVLVPQPSQDRRFELSAEADLIDFDPERFSAQPAAPLSASRPKSSLAPQRLDRNAEIRKPEKPLPATPAKEISRVQRRIIRPAVTLENPQGLDLDLEILDSDPEVPILRPERQPARPRRKVPEKVPKKTNPDGLDLDLEFVDSEDEMPVLPPRYVPPPPPPEEPKPIKVKLRTKHRDAMVWILLVALLPLAIKICLPSVPLATRIQKTLEQLPKNPEEGEEEEDEAATPHEFVLLNPDVTLAGAHLPRESNVHWLYGALATLAYFTLLVFMRSRTKVSHLRLLLTGIATGTLGIAMLFLFQILAEISLHTRVIGGGTGALVLMILRFIGFSYRCAMDPNNGFLLSFVGFTCGVGFCEEVCKAVPIMMYLRATPKADWRGTCLLGLASGVGFGISEGIMYSSSYYNGVEPGFTYLVRFASCVALHAMWSGTVALLMFGNQDYIDGGDDFPTFFWGILQYVLIAMVLHGLYDTMLKQHLDILALVVALGSFGWMAWLSKYYWDYRPSPA